MFEPHTFDSWKLFSFKNKKVTSVQSKAKPVVKRSSHALANYKGELILATGGY